MSLSSSAAEKNRRIVLLGNDPADGQWSMLEYGEQLQKTLASLAGNDLKITLRFPDSRRLSPWLRRGPWGRAAAMYLSRYLLYPPLLRKENPGLAHILDHGNAWLIRFLDPSRTVITCHDLIPLVLKDQRRSVLPWLSERAFGQVLSGLRTAARIIANSPCTRRDLISILGCRPEKISVIPLGLDSGLRPASSPQETAEIRASFRLPPEKLLLHVGQNVFYKNIEGVLETLGVLAHRGEPVRLVRAGSLLRPEQRVLARKLGVEDLLIELGPLSRTQVHRLYRAVDLLVYPSWYEGLGLPPLEALVSGIPVVVSNRGALPETIGEAGLLAPPDAPEQIADAVQRLLHDGDLRENLRVRGLERASRFRWEETAERTLAAYDQLLKSL